MYACVCELFLSVSSGLSVSASGPASTIAIGNLNANVLFIAWMQKIGDVWGKKALTLEIK